MNRADKFLNESNELLELSLFEFEEAKIFDEIEETVIDYIDDRGGICVLESGDWCFSDELEDLEDDSLEEATVRKFRYGKNITVHTLTGARKAAATKAGRKNIKSNLSMLKRKAHSAAAERLRRKTMEKEGVWKRGGATKKTSTTPRKPTRPKSPMGSRMKSRI